MTAVTHHSDSLKLPTKDLDASASLSSLSIPDRSVYSSDGDCEPRPSDNPLIEAHQETITAPRSWPNNYCRWN